MANLTSDDVKHVAKLAKLSLANEEIKKFFSQLSNILNHIDELNEVDTKNIEPTSQTTGLTNVMRQDQIDAVRILSQEEALSGKDNTQNGFFVVPQILKK